MLYVDSRNRLPKQQQQQRLKQQQQQQRLIIVKPKVVKRRIFHCLLRKPLDRSFYKIIKNAPLLTVMGYGM